MTACAIEPTAADENGDECGDPRTGGTQCAITADGSYAARLAPAGDCLFPERWTLDGPEPYAVPLPGNPAGGARHRGAADGRRAGAHPAAGGRAARVLAALPDRPGHR